MKTIMLTLLLAASSAQADEAAQLEAAKAAITRTLKDPESARFADLRIGRAKNGDAVVCGTVNAKNSFGGYTGPAPFFYIDDKMFRVIGNRDPMQPIFDSFCAPR